jgi:hypothetical protein
MANEFALTIDVDKSATTSNRPWQQRANSRLAGLRVNQDLAVSVRSSLLVQHDAQERSVDLKTAVVLNESELSEFVHKKIDS